MSFGHAQKLHREQRTTYSKPKDKLSNFNAVLIACILIPMGCCAALLFYLVCFVDDQFSG